jgi:hypothetical protein
MVTQRRKVIITLPLIRCTENSSPEKQISKANEKLPTPELKQAHRALYGYSSYRG